jgi:hypothetical protein
MQDRPHSLHQGRWADGAGERLATEGIMMPPRKHAVELALDFFSRGVLVVHPKDLSGLSEMDGAIAELARACHIYLIVTRPRLRFAPGSVVVGPDHTTVNFRFTRDGAEREATLTLVGSPNADSVEVSSYPHTNLLLLKDGVPVHVLPAHMLSFVGDGLTDRSIRDLEVVYVGMAYGEGDRSATDRLLSHSTLQQVLADLNGESPDTEALVVMAEYEPPLFVMSIDGRSKTSPENADRNVGAAFSQAEEISEELRIALIEAGLIRHFQPGYNEKYKFRYPHPSHKILEEIYSIDFGALTVEIDTEVINARLFSKVQPPGFHHAASVDLHDPQTRQSFFNIMNVPDGPTAADHSGPVF